MRFSFCSFIRNRKNESEIVNFFDPTGPRNLLCPPRGEDNGPATSEWLILPASFPAYRCICSQTAREKPGKLEARSENLDILVFGKYVFHHTDAQIKEFKIGEILCGVSQNGNRKF